MRIFQRLLYPNIFPLLVVYLAFLIIEFALLLQLSMGFISMWYDCAKIISAMTSVLIIISWVIDRKFKYQLKKYFIGCAIISFILPFSIEPVQSLQEKITKERVVFVIKALDSYKKEKGFYPIILNDLSPTYLNEVPHPLTGVIPYEFSYQIDGIEYTIAYSGFNGFVTKYSSKENNWYSYD